MLSNDEIQSAMLKLWSTNKTKDMKMKFFLNILRKLVSIPQNIFIKTLNLKVQLLIISINPVCETFKGLHCSPKIKVENELSKRDFTKIVLYMLLYLLFTDW